MLRLAFVLHLFIGTTLAGIGVVAALASGMDTLTPILVGGGLGYLLSFPATWGVAKMIYAAGA
ncbi:CTP synthetase [Shimia sp.]|uniref:CTP synthetase n=1 Tax=Shimia sp. TaxID=1954381 RepID=UPI0032969A81